MGSEVPARTKTECGKDKNSEVDGRTHSVRLRIIVFKIKLGLNYRRQDDGNLCKEVLPYDKKTEMLQ